MCVCVMCSVEVLPLMRAINSQACSLEAGRRWSVALIRQGGHVEYGRIPDYMVRVTCVQQLRAPCLALNVLSCT